MSAATTSPVSRSASGASAHRHPRRRLRALDERAIARAAEILRAAADPGRLRLLDRLADGPLCVGELAEESGDGLSLTSQRLRILHGAHLVVRRRAGKHVYYGLADAHVGELVRQVLTHATHEHQPATEDAP